MPVIGYDKAQEQIQLAQVACAEQRGVTAATRTDQADEFRFGDLQLQPVAS